MIAYVVIFVYAAGLPFVIWGFLCGSRDMKWLPWLLSFVGLLTYSLLTGDGTLGASGTGDAIYLGQAIAAVTLFLLGRKLACWPGRLSRLFDILPALCVVGLAYWSVLIFPFWVYYANSILGPLTVAASSAQS